MAALYNQAVSQEAIVGFPEPEPEQALRSGLEPAAEPGSAPERASDTPEIDDRRLELRRIALQHVRKLGDPVLRTRALAV